MPEYEIKVVTLTRNGKTTTGSVGLCKTRMGLTEFLRDSERGVHDESFILLGIKLSKDWTEYTLGIGGSLAKNTANAAKNVVLNSQGGFLLNIGSILGKSVINTLNLHKDPFNTLILGRWHPRKYDCGRWGGYP